MDEIKYVFRNHTYDVMKRGNPELSFVTPGQTGLVLDREEVLQLMSSLDQVRTDTIQKVIQSKYNKGSLIPSLIDNRFKNIYITF